MPRLPGRGLGAAFDACAACGSTWLVKALGDVACRACGSTAAAVVAEAPGGPAGSATDRSRVDAALGDEVAAALARVLGHVRPRTEDVGAEGLEPPAASL